MPRFSANLTMLFQEYGFLDRFDAAARAGFMAVEYVSPYEHPPEIVAERLKRNGLTQALFNMPAGDWAAGERGIAILPDRVEEFRKSVDTTIAYARALGCERVNCLAGLAPEGLDRETMESVLVENLRYAAQRLADAGVKLLIEPINPRDIPGFFVNTSRHALAIMDKVGSDNLYLQYDIYHMQVMEGDLARTIEQNLGRIAHIQIADNPGRHEPGTGEISYPFLFGHLDRIGYDGWVGAEYRPLAGTEAGLGWLREVAEAG
ncbi:hydroxypyruvate isomerase [Pseudaminobacter sp. 19-2017]|uniref:Hydroxypyruvate isomerase n=1 Tax=Pseudaminobacter soli (ex Zhang et al. 2022) TaxID=2831468 RepID=A0A942E0Y2_9HYPH|nr:hydroxypyruvate isomerase [Pseudaminobacter soli]MBS3651819.1 hydroxypyruvate isomerase [Pseudaminobacter soli]